ncbi:hypothetical protein [Streptomyces ehimensis]|uniref:Uncharacterized protein n=1 Tax=Streptomyces ehimensis TaxID=68195 RepID=A0ABV9BCS2_9ACTN
MERKKPLLAGRQEFARLYNVTENALNVRWVPRGLLSYDDAVIVSGKYVFPGGVAVGFALPEGSNGRQLDKAALAELVKEQGATWTPETKAELPKLMGTHEYAELYGTSHSRVAGYVKASSPLVVKPDYYVSSSPVWFVDTVLAYAPTAAAASRTGVWSMREDVAEALRSGTYDGPGSAIVARGRYAAKAD